MPVFPRARYALPRLATPPRFPQALQSWGQSGKGQMRSTGILGREWEETYPVLDTARPSVRALLAAINQGLREGTVWQVKHPYWNTRLGDAGAPGTPLVAGANQTGASLAIDGLWANSCTAPNGIASSPWVNDGSGITTQAAAGIAPDGTLTAVAVTDSSTGSLAGRRFSVTVPDDTAVHLVGAYVEKRAAGTAYPAVSLVYEGGTGITYSAILNPETGAHLATNSPTASGVIDVDTRWWFVWIAAPNNGTGNTNLRVSLRPSVRSDFNAASTTPAATGTTLYWGARIQLNTSTPTLPVKPWLHKGDLIHVSGLPVVLDVAADVVLLGASATIDIHPPIFAGQSPADNAVVVVDPADIYFNAVLVDVGDFPQMDSTRYIDAGLTLTWREQPG